MLGRPDYFLTVKREIKSVKELKGKRIASGSFGAAADLALRTVAKQDGLDPDRDLVRLQMRGGGARYAALLGGSVDATILTLPYNLQAEKAGYKDLLKYSRTGYESTRKSPCEATISAGAVGWKEVSFPTQR
ncbi:MAG: ABC transporter substrate-binding protein [Deltaproteobacteria bacterium]|nr:ABC transporter substrate-binding protein [Deltaproteobacteria bacterium]